ncbi:TIGR00270 family protein [Candidatus Micrarchaeota archaeon]|nr:TIGR00270 family protein [Candidatus Micrarchaeota archaeon]
MECEICGKNTAVRIVKVEGAKLEVCQFCAKDGVFVSEIKEEYPSGKQSFEKETKIKTKLEKEIVDNYKIEIQNGIRDMGIDVDILAEKLRIKYSYLNNVVHGKITPDLKLAERLEKELNIVLIEDIVIENNGETRNKKNDEITLGDIVNIE